MSRYHDHQLQVSENLSIYSFICSFHIIHQSDLCVKIYISTSFLFDAIRKVDVEKN